MNRSAKIWLLAGAALAFNACAESSQSALEGAPTELVPMSVSQARTHFRRGVELAAQGRQTEAIQAYLEAVRLDPAYLETHYNLGNSYARQLDYSRAIEAYRHVLQRDSTHISARHNLAAMYVRQLNYAQAITEHQRVLEQNPEHASTYYDLAYIHFIRGEYDRAGELVAAGLKRRPDEADYFRLRGRMLFKELDFDGARQAYLQAVRLDSAHAPTFVELAQVELKAGRYREAADLCQRSLDLKADQKEAYFVLANAYRRLGRTADSHELLAKFRQLDEADARIDKQLRILANDPVDHEARAMLGLLYGRQDRLEEALEAYRLAVQLAPDSARYHNNLGNLHLRLQHYDDAVRAYEAALNLDSLYVRARYNLGLAHLHQQHFDRAFKALKAALAQQPEDADINYYLGLLYAREDDFAGAAQALEQAVRSRPSFLDARQKLAVSYLKLGRLEESKLEMQTLQQMQAGIEQNDDSPTP